jgi:uncharacterized membrane protein
VDFYAWMLALHLLSVFAIAAALILFAVLVFAGRRMKTLDETRRLFRLGNIGGPLVGAGSVAALIFGVILAIDSDQFEIWDGWVIAAIVLWAVMGAVGGRSGKYYGDIQKVADKGEPGVEQEVFARLRAPTGPALTVGTLAIFVLILLDMLFKPGA